LFKMKLLHARHTESPKLQACEIRARLSMHKIDHLIYNARLLQLTAASKLTTIDDGAIAIEDGLIAWIGPQSQMPTKWRKQAKHATNLRGALLTPGLIDAHTHAVFTGDRAGEFARRLDGESYADISRSGGGIMASVRAVREQSEDALVLASTNRLGELLANGVTTIEIKSGYGLSFADEAKQLAAAKRCADELGLQVQRTYLALHALPPEFAGRRGAFVDTVANIWLPDLHHRGLVDAVDVFMEHIAFNEFECMQVLSAAKSLGLPIKIHADQLKHSGGGALAAQLRALSADHLEYTSAADVAAMAKAGVVAGILPVAWYQLGDFQKPPIKALRQHAVPMMVASDLNPGTAPCTSLRLAMNMACVLFGLTVEEAIRGVTVNAAKALGLIDRGSLETGLRADFAVWEVQDPAELVYWMGGQFCRQTWIGGQQLQSR
jgi:imidazolonepropionase